MSTSNNVKRAKYFFGMAIVWVLYRFWGNTLFSQLNDPRIITPDVDNSFWLLQLLQIPEFITSNQTIATLLDISMLFLPMLYLLKPNRWYAMFFSVVLTLYNSCFSIYSGHHFHSLLGIVFVSIPFWSDNLKRRENLWHAVRYYFLFSMVSAALWKVGRGAIFDVNFMTETLKIQHAQYIFDFPESMLSSWYKWLIQSQAVAYGFYIAATIIELSFIVGFFTKKFDQSLLVLFLIFAIANLVAMGVSSFELIFFLLTLLF